jgi:hypothetical protein
MEQIKIGTHVEFESFTKPKTIVNGEVIKIFISKKDNKEYCQIKHNGKTISKQLNKVTIKIK